MDSTSDSREAPDDEDGVQDIVDEILSNESLHSEKLELAPVLFAAPHSSRTSTSTSKTEQAELESSGISKVAEIKGIGVGTVTKEVLTVKAGTVGAAITQGREEGTYQRVRESFMKSKIDTKESSAAYSYALATESSDDTAARSSDNTAARSSDDTAARLSVAPLPSSVPGAYSHHPLGDLPRPERREDARTPNNSNVNSTREGTDDLAVANPVEGDLHVVQASVHDPNARQATMQVRRRKDIKRLCYAVIPVLLLSVIIILALFLARAGGSDEDTPSSPETTAPTKQTPEMYVTSLLPKYTQEALKMPESPQAQAFQWIVADPSLGRYGDDRVIQRFALATFYFAAGGDHWIDSSNWLSYDMHECHWFMQADFAQSNMLSALYPGWLTEFTIPHNAPCDQNGLFRNFWMDQNNIMGSELPLELYLLTSLQTLSYGFNPFSGTLSSHMGQLTNLQGLVLVALAAATTIPSEVGLLTDMKVFGIASKSAGGSLPTEVGLLSDMEYLSLSSNPDLRGTIPYNFPKLKWLTMSESLFTGTISTEIGVMHDLRFLSTSHNNLGSSLPTEIGNLQNLTRLHLVNNQLTGPLPSALGRLTKLSVLKIQNNFFSGSLPTELSSVVSLKRFEANNNNFRGHIPTVFASLASLRCFFVANNSLTGSIPEEMEALAASIFQLDFSGNPDLTGQAPKSFCSINSTCQEDANTWDPCIGSPGLKLDCTNSLCGCSCLCAPEATNASSSRHSS